MKRRFSFSLILTFVTIVLIVSSIVLNFINDKIELELPFYLLCSTIPLLFLIFFITFNSQKSSEYVKTLEQRLSLWNTISYKVKKAGENAFTKYPIGVVILDKNRNVMWSNQCAKDILHDELEHKIYLNKVLRKNNVVSLANSKLNIFLDHATEAMKSGETTFKEIIKFFKNDYEVTCCENGQIIYLQDITDYLDLQTKYRNRTLAIGYVNVDNLEETLSDYDVQDRSEYQGKILSTIVQWFENFGVYVRAFSDSRYLLISSREQLEQMMANEFTIVDQIKLILRSYRTGRITLSISVTCDDLSVYELAKSAEDQLDLALSRGGDQVIVKLDGKTKSYGATTDPIYKESNVQIRYKYQELEYLIKHSDIVFSIGHNIQDADAFASALAIHNLSVALGKQSYIIIKEENMDPTVKKVIEDVKKFLPSLYKVMITPEQAVNRVTDNSLLMVVDCQSEKQLYLTESQFKAFKKVGVIDHHRKNEHGTIKDPAFYYTEPAGSSCIELIISLFKYCDVPLGITPSEANWMLLGMVVDTNNFVYRTSGKTFEVASILYGYGSDSKTVKEYLKEDFTEKQFRNKLIAEAETYRGGKVMIANAGETILQDGTVLSRISDEMLMIAGVELAITISYVGNENLIKISTRSLGGNAGFNSQVLMEQFKGGGHLTAAAAVIKNTKNENDKSTYYLAPFSIPELIVRLKNTIDNLFKEVDVMKIIFIVDEKGKGKKGEIKEFAAGYGQFLINSKKAVLATSENLRILEEEKAEQKAEALRLVQKMKDIKELIESKPITIEVKIGADGLVLGKVTTKHIADAIEKQIKQKVEKAKISLTSQVNALGHYEAMIKLHEEVIANITIHVVEAKSGK